MLIPYSLHDLYGKYEIPSLILKIMEKQTQGNYEDGVIGMYLLKVDDHRYMSTPPDVIPFATIGADGIHYGFLTDFGTVADLNEAPVVCICPMDFGSEIRYIARNLKEFLEVLCTDEYIVINHFSDRDEYMQFIKRQEEEESREPEEGEFRLSNETLQQLKDEREQFMADFDLQRVPDVWTYIEDVRAERQSQSVLETLNGLGVLPIPVESSDQHAQKEHSRFDWRYDEHNNVFNELDEACEFLEHASLESRIGFIRDAQHLYVFQKLIWLERVTELLVLWGYAAEAEGLKEAYL